MKLETFFEKFDSFVEAPDAVAKMRGLILRLAMQGRLSEAHKTDVPVSELLREVEKDKMRLGLVNSAKATSGNLYFSDDETTDEIPARWDWVRFGNIARHNAGKTLDKGRNRGKLRDYITTSNLYWGYFQLDAVRQMPILDDELERCTANKGDLLICEGGEAGRAAVWPHDHAISFQNHVHRARFFAEINPYFVQRYFEKLNATGEIEKYRKGVGISNMSGKALASIPIPLPPLAEQKRIVAKVDELMALCDRLEAQQQERETRHAELARASLARFAEAPTPANLNFLFHPSYTISPADLRKSILTLAVQGKLVPQDPNDEDAEDLLARIRGDLHAQKKGSKADPYKIADDELPYEVPFGWCWSCVQELAQPNESVTYGILKPVWVEAGVPTVRVTEMKTGFIDVEALPKCDPQRAAKFSKTTLNEGDLLVSKDGTIGKTAFVPRELAGGNITQHMLRFAISKRLDRGFIRLCIDAPPCQAWMVGETKGVALQGVNVGDFRRMPIPLPPLDEQRRIVAKVDQLMALVDELEAQLAASRASAANLLMALIAELTGIPEGRVASPAPANLVAASLRPNPQIATVAVTKPAAQESTVSHRTLADLRKAAGLTQAAVAEALGLNQAYISQMETGKRPITKEKHGNLLKIFGMNADEVPR